MSQRFRRNVAPVLGALALLGLGVAAWAMLGAHRTQLATAELHAQFAVGASPWEFRAPADGYAVFVYGKGDTVCATLSLQPDAATLVLPPMVTRSLDRAGYATLLAELAPLAADCDTVWVRVFATRMPYHGRFEARYADGAISRRGEFDFGS